MAILSNNQRIGNYEVSSVEHIVMNKLANVNM